MLFFPVYYLAAGISSGGKHEAESVRYGNPFLQKAGPPGDGGRQEGRDGGKGLRGWNFLLLRTISNFTYEMAEE